MIIIGGIYGGVFTATEAAAVSFVTGTVIAFATRRITMAGFVAALAETASQTAAIFLIAGAAKIFVSFVSLTGIAHVMVDLVQVADPGPVLLLVLDGIIKRTRR